MKFIFLGPQGSGKSTQAKMLASELSLPYIEMGQLLRDKMNGNDDVGKAIKEAMETGTLVENQITIRTLNQRLENQDCKNGFVLDGYPRNDMQLNNLPEGIDKVIYINIPDQEAVRRLSNRGRDDDTPEVIQKRLDVYHHQTEPLLSSFRNNNFLMEIDGGKAIDEVYNEIKKQIAPRPE